MGLYTTCPYNRLKNEAFWKKSVVSLSPNEILPGLKENGFVIKRRDKIATAGSCFAQNISRFLIKANYNFYVAEKPADFFPIDLYKDFNYTTYSARYGNIYTVRQLLQTFERAFNELDPKSYIWVAEDNTFIDPFRPFIQKGNYISANELNLDRKRHYDAVRSVFSHSDVFIFTLGLTESWKEKKTNIVFPVAPGCGVGNFDNSKYEFHNFNFIEIIDDFSLFYEKVKIANPSIKFILTVSPVPLMATYTNDHVLSANEYSKSVLRVAAHELCNKLPDVYYFPSYEIIRSPSSRGAYYNSDLRNINEAGLEQVMKNFFYQFTNRVIEDLFTDISPHPLSHDDLTSKIDIICDEELSLNGT